MANTSRRETKIIEYLEQNESAEISELSKVFGVSDMTIRRDLSKMEKEGLVTRFHGGAERKRNIIRGPESGYMSRLEMSGPEKRAIGKAAAAYLRRRLKSDVMRSVFFANGTTVVEVVSQLSGIKNVTIFTDNIPCAQQAAAVTEDPIVLIGGQLNRISMNTVGHFADEMIRSLSLDVAVIGTAAIDEGGNIYAYNMELAGLYSAIIKASNHIIVLADHEKIGKKAMIYLCRMDSDFTLVTDTAVPRETIKSIRTTGAGVIVASKGKNE